MTTIGLVRHGITEWNELGKAQGVSDIPLNKIGKQQALLIFYRSNRSFSCISDKYCAVSFIRDFVKKG
ncbi:histidine phosphatase family protein [Sporosarcina limicola]|uniref:Broad specificity phosphatase PhoE n=1 Tax=Sporosarcina limicola TaxID=34101 RepID=A0A927R504_9BACL|nr:broad specificity phosphatase PhoE [Sporosarcina limicola]